MARASRVWRIQSARFSPTSDAARAQRSLRTFHVDGIGLRVVIRRAPR